MSSVEMDQLCYTRTGIKIFTYKWIITKFSSRPENTGESFKSSTFRSPDLDDHNWYLILFPKGINDSCSNSISLYLVQETNCQKGAHTILRVEVYVQNNKGEKGNHYGTNIVPCYNRPINLGWLCFLSRVNDQNITPKLCDMLHNDELTIICTISAIKYLQCDGNLKLKIPESRILEDFGKLLINEDLNDVTLSVNGHDFKAHKAILAARSPVFAAMFKHDMQETRNNQVIITDIDTDVFHEMLQFIYTGKSSNVKKFPAKLLQASDKYGLDRLKAMCEKALSKSLTEENAADTLILADLYGAQQLTNVTVYFIVTHCAAVMRTKGWKSIVTNPALMQMVNHLALPTTSNEAT